MSLNSHRPFKKKHQLIFFENMNNSFSSEPLTVSAIFEKGLDSEKLEKVDQVLVVEELTAGEETGEEVIQIENKPDRDKDGKNANSSFFAKVENTNGKSAANTTNSESESEEDIGNKYNGSISTIFTSLDSSDDDNSALQNVVEKELLNSNVEEDLERPSKNVTNIDDEGILTNSQAANTSQMMQTKVRKGEEETIGSIGSVHLANGDKHLPKSRVTQMRDEIADAGVQKENITESLVNISIGQDDPMLNMVNDVDNYLVAPKASIWLLCLTGKTAKKIM